VRCRITVTSNGRRRFRFIGHLARPPGQQREFGCFRQFQRTRIGALAHNLLRWTQLLGLPDTTIRAARTLRRRLLQLPGRLTRHARGWTLHLPARWPWHGDYISALNAIRALPAA
jgi:hypothetical protein